MEGGSVVDGCDLGYSVARQGGKPLEPCPKPLTYEVWSKLEHRNYKGKEEAIHAEEESHA